MSAEIYEGWVVVFKSGTDYEADLVRDRLDDSGLPAVVLTQRDHAFNMTMGEMALVRVLVPPEHVQAAMRVLESEPVSDEELDAAALTATVPQGMDADNESLLDSGIEAIHFAPPKHDEGEEKD